MIGVTLLTVPAIQYGGYFLLRFITGQIAGETPTALQTMFFRAGHAHAGVIVILSLVCQMAVEYAALSPGLQWSVRLAVPLAAILMPAGFFLAVTFTPQSPNGFINLLYLGAGFLAYGVITLGVGLIRGRV
jgi:Ni,Fe-hydrogenase I cytochrome b subunit